MEVYKVYWLEEHEEEEYYRCWIPVPLEMCREGLLCKDCEKLGKPSDDCSFMFIYTPEKQVAEDKKKEIEARGVKVKIEKTSIPPTRERAGILEEVL